MDTRLDDSSPHYRATSARDALQARADASEAARSLPEFSADSSICDRYFYAAIAHFTLAAQAPDDATFFAQYQAGQAYLLLGQACLDQVAGGTT